MKSWIDCIINPWAHLQSWLPPDSRVLAVLTACHMRALRPSPHFRNPQPVRGHAGCRKSESFLVGLRTKLSQLFWNPRRGVMSGGILLVHHRCDPHDVLLCLSFWPLRFDPYGPNFCWLIWSESNMHLEIMICTWICTMLSARAHDYCVSIYISPWYISRVDRKGNAGERPSTITKRDRQNWGRKRRGKWNGTMKDGSKG